MEISNFLNGLIRANYKFSKTTKEDKQFTFIEHINIINPGIDLNGKIKHPHKIFILDEIFKLKTLESYNSIIARELGNTRANVATNKNKD